jgi:sigma-B regulation protein RsbU (phosphoserine phosphatase)
MDEREIAPAQVRRLTSAQIEALLDVIRGLAAPFAQTDMLRAVAAAACRLLRAERASVWLYDAPADELVLEVSRDLPPVRHPLHLGLSGACARERRLLNVPDCYADARFDPSMDRRSGRVTRCSLSVPLLLHDGALVGVLQVMNRHGGVFDAADESLATALAAQCAIALERTRAVAAAIAAERLQQEMEAARVVQASTLPMQMPALPGFEMAGLSQPCDATGGDSFDLSLQGGGLFVFLADASGHGIAPALSVLRLQAMLRTALRLGAGLEAAYRDANDELAQTLPPGRFVTAFVGRLEPATATLRYLSGGHAPTLHWRAADASIGRLGATSFPLGAMPLPADRPARELVLAPGDVLLLLSDGVHEQESAAGDALGIEAVEAVLGAHAHAPAAAIADALLARWQAHRGSAPQADDVSLAVLRRVTELS